RLRASRKRAQKLRNVHDRDLRELQIGSGTRLGVFVSHHLQTDERLRSFGDRGRSAVGAMSDRVRGPAAFAVMAFAVMVVVAGRAGLGGGGSVGGPSVGEPSPDPRRRGRFLRLSLLVALVAAWYPVAPGLCVLAAATFVRAAPFARGWGSAFRAVGTAAAAA